MAVQGAGDVAVAGQGAGLGPAVGDQPGPAVPGPGPVAGAGQDLLQEGFVVV
ncbi:MAG: hypothetical protein JO037_21985 [Actinobacteria bacterium]|nr:hypothetical protein [Actinomycetota bacterium]